MSAGIIKVNSAIIHIYLIASQNSGLICGNINKGVILVTNLEVNSSVYYVGSGSGSGTLFGTVSGTITVDSLANINVTGTFASMPCSSGCTGITEGIS